MIFKIELNYLNILNNYFKYTNFERLNYSLYKVIIKLY